MQWIIANKKRPDMRWSNEYGWIAGNYHDTFSTEERQTLSLPMEGEWQVANTTTPRRKESQNRHWMLKALQGSGISLDDVEKLRRISMTLHRWHELECGDSNDYGSWTIERNEITNKPFVVFHPYRPAGIVTRYATPDRETGALKRLAAIMARYPSLQSYVQGDPRGCALYVLRPGDVPEGADPSAYYSRGIAVY